MPKVPTYGNQRVSAAAAPLARRATQDYSSPRGPATAAFGADVAAANAEAASGLQAAGEKLGRIAINMQIENNEREAKQLDVEFSRRLRMFGHGDGTPENPGFYNLRGENAIQAFDGANTSLEKLRADIAAQASNDRVREMFDTASAVRFETEMSRVSTFAANERRAANAAASAARIAEARDDASAAWNDANVLNRSLGVARAEVLDQGEREGWGPDVLAHQLEKAQTEIIVAAIDAAMVSDPMAAQGIYNRNRFRMDGPARAAAEKALQGATLLQQAQTEADSIMSLGLSERDALARARSLTNAQLRDDVVTRVKARYAEERRFAEEVDTAQYAQNAGDRLIALGSEREAIEAARSIEDADLRKATIDYIEDFYATDRRLRDEENEDVAQDRADAIVGQVGGEAGDEGEALDLARQIPEDKLRQEVEGLLRQRYSDVRRQQDQAREQAMRDARAHINNRGKYAEWALANPRQAALINEMDGAVGELRKLENSVAEGNLYASATDGVTLNNLRNMEPAQLATVDLLSVRPRLTEEEFGKAVSLHEAAKKRMETLQNGGELYNRGEQVLKELAPQSMDWGLKSASDEDRKRRTALTNEMTAWINGRLEQGKPPTEQEIRQQAIRLMLPVVGNPQGMFNEFEGFAGEIARMTPEQRAVARVDAETLLDTMPQQYDKLRAALENAGLEVTADRIEKLAGAWLMGDTARRDRILAGGE